MGLRRLFAEGLVLFLVTTGFTGLTPLLSTVQAEGEVGANFEREVESLALAGQCLAESQALYGQGGSFSTHCVSSHFYSFF